MTDVRPSGSCLRSPVLPGSNRTAVAGLVLQIGIHPVVHVLVGILRPALAATRLRRAERLTIMRIAAAYFVGFQRWRRRRRWPPVCSSQNSRASRWQLIEQAVSV